MFDLFIRRLEEVFTLPLGCEGSMSEDTVTFFFSRGTRTIIGAAVVGEMFEQRGACSGPMWSTTWYVLYARYFLCRGMSHEAGGRCGRSWFSLLAVFSPTACLFFFHMHGV